MRPSAIAAAEATSGSASPRRCARAPVACESRRTPIEFKTPTSSRPCTWPTASRSAASAAGSGIASRAMRAQDASSSFVSSLAKAGTAFLVPWTASCLQVIALSAGGAADSNTAINWPSLSAAAFASSAAGIGRTAIVIATIARATTLMIFRSLNMFSFSVAAGWWTAPVHRTPGISNSDFMSSTLGNDCDRWSVVEPRLSTVREWPPTANGWPVRRR